MPSTLKDNPLFPGERLVYASAPDSVVNDTYYSDRLHQWDWEKFDECAIKAFGIPAQIWTGYRKEQIEGFLRDYFRSEIVVHRLSFVEVRGYPIFRCDVWNPGMEVPSA